MGQLELDTPVQYVKAVGPARAAQLAELGIRTVEDLLMYFPRRFDLRRQAQPIGTLRGDEPAATVAGEVLAVQEQRFGRRPWFACQIADGTGFVLAKWFHGGYLRDKITVGMVLAVSGKASVYKETLQFINPQFFLLDDRGGNLQADELLPIYPAGARLTSTTIGKIVRNALPQTQTLIREWFDRDYLQNRGLPTRPSAVVAMHHPEDADQWRSARRRMAYDEFLLMQLGIALTRMNEVSRPAHPLACSEQIDRRIRARFPFPLTAAQDRTVAEITADLAREKPMNRLLQGDVGAGKTVVALYAALLAVAKGKQAAIMAPTEILAVQHHRKVCDYLAGSKVRTALLVGGQKPSERTEILRQLAEGTVDIVVGTQALLGQRVRFSQLALVIVDEQHKFGVRQRSGIRSKGFAPHYLVMTATPIPRTLAMTVFGDLDVSVIDALPPGRGRTTTRCVSANQFDAAMAEVANRLQAGQQAYFIYPLVNPSDNPSLTAAMVAYEQLAAGPLGRFGVGLIHGQMPANQKQAAMEAFRAGRTRVLVASVVVEVGLDIPAANVMVVTHAERFGLAQLHQMRGRIGRAGQDALCILLASPNNPLARRRLEILEATSDGFKIAEEDLRLRGPGELFGTRQHGLPELRVGDLIEDFELLRLARRDAFAIVAEDPTLSAPHHQSLCRAMQKAYAGRLNLLTGA